MSDEQAHALAAEGKSVIWIDGGLHATEVLGAQQLIELQYQMDTRNDPETMRFLNDDILITCLVNPDGMELVSNWYMRDPDPEKRSTANVPVLYNKYAGHDDNRDFYMVNLSESDAINRILYREFYPVIMYNHHQTGPAGTVMFSPPFRDPFNFNFDPLIVSELDEVAAAMHSRFIAEDKPGVTMRSGATYSTWYNGGLRTSTYFHNIIGILTEAIGNPTPQEIPLVFRQQLPRQDLMYPIAPQLWHFRQSIEYSITADRAILDYASRHKDQLLFNQYLMGKNSIERGNRDSWTISPHRLDAVETAANDERQQEQRGGQRQPVAEFRRGCLLGEECVYRGRQEVARRDRLHSGQSVDAAEAAEACGGGRLEFRSCSGKAAGRSPDAQASAHRPGGPLRRLDVFRMDPLRTREVRIRIHSSVPAGSGSGWSVTEIRCAYRAERSRAVGSGRARRRRRRARGRRSEQPGRYPRRIS
ncbi:MAG TPA: M14 family metallopeptidase [Terriglobia bacterium]